MSEEFIGGPINWADEIPRATREELEGLADQTLESMDSATPITPDEVITKLTESGQELSATRRDFLRDYLGEKLRPEE